MNIHEYQAKDLLKAYGLPVPPGGVAYSDADAARVAEEIGGRRWVAKAQVHAGGRGKAGGVRLVDSIPKLREVVDRMLGSRLVTEQTDDRGTVVRRVLVERAARIERELYLGLIVDRTTQRIIVIASADGGVDVEEVARDHPERIHKEVVDPATGLLDFQCRKLAAAMDLHDRPQRLVRIMKQFYRCFRDTDALMAEINPLVVTDEGDLLVLDAKMTFDDNSLFRHPEITELRDFDEEDPKEVEASGHGLNYIALDGRVGCIVNGAGLAMATMDAVVLHGARPANFLDVGGGASPEKVANAFRIVLKDPNVKAILVNIFAGINRCDWVAQGVVQATRDQEIDLPIVVRLAGTNVDEGRRILAESRLSLITAEDLDDAAAKAVASLEGVLA